MATRSKSVTPDKRRGGARKKGDGDDLVFTILTKETIDDLDKCNDTNTELTILAETFGLSGWVGDLPASIQLNMYHNLYIFAKENKFTSYQTSILFSLFKITLDKLIESSFQSFAFIEEFKTLLMKQFKQDVGVSNGSVANGSVSNGVSNNGTLSNGAHLLNLEVTSLIIQYVSKSLFQHINLYKFVFTHEQECGVLLESRKLELPPLNFLPLEEAKTAESVQQQENEERLRLANIDTFNSEVDIFESLSPEEIKKVTAETVLNLIDHFQQETEKIMLDQKAKTQMMNQKLIKE